MKPRLKVIAVIDKAKNARKVVDGVKSYLVGKDIFERVNLVATKDVLENNQIVLVVDIMFTNSVDRDAVKDWIIDQVQNNPRVKTWVQKATASWHLCSHDEPSDRWVDCRTSQFFEWVRP